MGRRLIVVGNIYGRDNDKHLGVYRRTVLKLLPRKLDVSGQRPMARIY
jgi:hypothetical protein